MTQTESISIEKGDKIGKCPEHGLVVRDELDWNFPNPATCECGEELESATIAPESKEVTL